MIRGIIGSSLSFRFLVLVLALVMMVAGIMQLREMPVDFLPEFSPPYVEIQTEALGLSAKEVEQLITVPMEQDLLAGVAWLDIIHSESVAGLSSVVVYFEPGTDLYRARQMVAERIAQSAVGLPHVSTPPTMIQPLSSASRFIVVGVTSNKLSLIQTSVLARWVISPRLMGVPGVAHVAIWGNRDRQLQVLVNPEELQIKNVSLQQVVSSTGNALWVSPLSYLEASSPGTGGFIDTPNQRLGIWHVLPISSPEDLAQVPIEGAEDLRLGDVAQVVEDHQPLIGDAIVHDNANLLLVIEKLPGINTIKVTRDLETALAALQPGLSGIEFDSTIYRPATFIEMAMNNLARTFVVGAFLAVLLLFVFFYEWRVAFISLVTAVLSLVTALVVLYSRGVTMNAMVLAGLVVALGFVIDDSIRDVANIVQRLRQYREEGSEQPASVIVLEASLEIRRPVFLATLISALVVLPVFFLNGISGALFQTLAVTYLAALVASMVVALVVTPVLCLVFLPGAPLERRVSPLVPWLQRGYERLLARVMQKPRAAYVVIVLLLVSGLALQPLLNQGQLVPSFQEPYLLVQMEGAPGISHPEMSRIVSRASNELRLIPGVREVGAHIGRAIFGDQKVGINSAQMMVSIDPRADYTKTVAAVRDTVGGYTGLDCKVLTYTEQILNQTQSRASNSFTVRLFGEDYETLQSQAAALRQKLAEINGIASAQVVLPPEEPTLEIEVNLAAAQQYGIKPGDARRAAAILLSGLNVGNLFEEQKVFDVVVWGTPDIRKNLSDIQNLLIETPGGSHVRLSDVADVRLSSSPTVIRRAAVSPYLDISLDVRGRNVRAVMSDVNSAIHNFSFPLEYHAEVQGDFEAQQTMLQSLIIAGLIALMGILLLLQASTGSWKLALLTLLTLAAGLAGGWLAALLIDGHQLTLSSLAGLITVLAVAVRACVTLTSRYQTIEREKGGLSGQELILHGAVERLAPTLITVLTVTLILLPFIISGPIAGQEVIYPIAVVILGGMVTVTLTNLFVLPSLYLLYGASREPDLELTPAAASQGTERPTI